MGKKKKQDFVMEEVTGTVNINGKIFQASRQSISFKKGSIYLDDEIVENNFSEKGTGKIQINIIVKGNIEYVIGADAIAISGNVKGDVEDCNCVAIAGTVSGDVEAKENVICGNNISGDVTAKGNVTCYGNIKGDVEAHHNIYKM